MPATPDQNANAPETKAVCACDSIVNRWNIKEARGACVGEAVYEHEGKSFCVMHYPSQSKVEAFRSAFHQKLDAENFNFCGVYFPEVINFSAYKKTEAKGFCFSSEANFHQATFGVEVNFDSATFSENADFTSATFCAIATFNSVTFSKDAIFAATTFSGLTLFIATYFARATVFAIAQFKDYLKFRQDEKEMFGADASLTFNSVRIDKPERVSFHSVNLRPHWFINTDPRKFEFIDVDWANDLTTEREASNSLRLLSIAYRQLAMNAEENNRYSEATQFRYNSMELRRLEKWKGWNIFSLDFWYWALSGYGERVNRAAVALLLILFLACVPYWFTGFASSKQDQDKVGAPIRVVLAKEKSPAKQLLATLAYSLETASLQKPEPRPVTTAARFFVGLETILAPLQAALLALAIRRKYMK